MALVMPSTVLASPIGLRLPLLASSRSAGFGVLRTLLSCKQPWFADSGRSMSSLRGSSKSSWQKNDWPALSSSRHAFSTFLRFGGSQQPFLRRFSASMERQANIPSRPASDPRPETIPSKASIQGQTSGSVKHEQESADIEVEEHDANINYGYIVAIPIIAICVCVLGAWNWSSRLPKSSIKDRVMNSISENAFLNLPNVVQGHWAALFGSAFMHSGLVHLGVNMFAMWSFLPMMYTLYGPSATLAISLMSQLGTAASSLYWKLLHGRFSGRNGKIPELADSLGKLSWFGKVPHANADPYILGASSCGFSGVLCGWISAIAFKTPKAPIQLFFVLNMPIAAGAGLFAAFSWYMVDQRKPIFDHPGHFGGALAGLVGAVAFRKYGSVPRMWRLFNRR